MKILIADSGSTKTDWCLAESGKILLRMKTPGMNPFFQTKEEMEAGLKEFLVPFLQHESIDEVCFYGAGCTPEKALVVRHVLETVLKVRAEVESDLLGAARALCGHGPGIACILGTGSNSCFYDGNKIAANIPPLGYVLGDEAGGAHLGKSLVREYLRGNLSPACQAAFYAKYGMEKDEILNFVYKQPFPNRFLAGFASFLPAWLDGEEDVCLRLVIKDCFSGFFRNCVKRYDYCSYPVNAIGSIAWYFREMIGEVAVEEETRLGIISQSPMEGLVCYHSNE